jgi:hypothetical protein
MSGTRNDWFCCDPAIKRPSIVGISFLCFLTLQPKDHLLLAFVFPFSTMIIQIPFCFCLVLGYSLSVAHQKLCQMIYQLALRNDKRARIAGSYALQQVMKDMGQTTFESNDIDVFTTLYFSVEDMVIFERKFDELCDDSYIIIDRLMDSYSRVDGMRQIWNFAILGIKRVGNLVELQRVYPPVQLIVVNKELPRNLQLNDHRFAKEVIDRFNISVCKCAIPNLFELNRAVAMSYSVILDIINCEMEYDLRKLKSTDNAWNRLLKYASRGFKPSRLRFGNSQVIHMVDGIIRIFE